MLPKNLLCFSPIRWDFKMHRPQQLLVRFADHANVYFFEEPVFDAIESPFLTFSTRSETLWKVVPHLSSDLTVEKANFYLAQLLDQLLEKANLDQWAFWFYTPTALPFTEKHKPKVVIYDRVEEAGSGADWNDVFRLVNQQIRNKLALSNVIAIHP